MNFPRTKRVFLFGGFLGMVVLAAMGPDDAPAQEYKVIVNAANPISALSKDRVSKLFLKKLTRWEDDKSVLPVNLPPESPVRQKFSLEIHGKNIAAIKSYWQQRIFSGQGVPPPEKVTEKEVVNYVQENPGAIGYVSETALVDKIKVLKITE